MALHDERSSRGGLHKLDESIFKPQLASRVELPGEEHTSFEEVQPFDQIWLWSLLGLELVIMVIAVLTAAAPLWIMAVCLGIMALTMALLGSLKLYTRIDADGVHFRMTPFHFREQTILWEEIDQIQVRKYSPIMEYGGWGIRIGLMGKAYNVKGDKGIQIVKKNGKRLLIGTQRPEEAASQLAAHPLLV